MNNFKVNERAIDYTIEEVTFAIAEAIDKGDKESETTLYLVKALLTKAAEKLN